MLTEIVHVRLAAPGALLPALAAFYGDLGLRLVGADAECLTTEVGETVLELCPGSGSPFYHIAFLVPGDRFEAALAWAGARIELLPDTETGAVVFDFTNWDAKAIYFHDPAGTIVELIAHRGVGETGVTGPFTASELLGLSEVGIVCDPPSLAAALEDELGLGLWDGTLEGETRLAFVGEKARTLILCRPGRPWLPTGRPAEAHPAEIVLAGVPEGMVALESGGWVRGASGDGAGATVKPS
jgi:catechol 2,3-dioxygenase-like lactoylglutathione lyase family enzyme